MPGGAWRMTVTVRQSQCEDTGLARMFGIACPIRLHKHLRQMGDVMSYSGHHGSVG